jgi:bisanhydrobacterioruberin hydratase
LLFHGFGALGIVANIYKDFFIQATPLNLLLMFGLLLATHRQRNRAFWLFVAICVVVGITVEVIGVNKGWLFGQYSYGTVLGPKWLGVPPLIGINWFITIYCCGATLQALLQKLLPAVDGTPLAGKKWSSLSMILDGAILAVCFDWLIEPVAVQLGYWAWGGSGAIPTYNYVCWWGISALLMACFHYSNFHKTNKFAVHLLLIQIMFFLVLRTFLSS